MLDLFVIYLCMQVYYKKVLYEWELLLSRINNVSVSAPFWGFGLTVEEGFIQKPITTKLESNSAHDGRKRPGLVHEAISSYNALRMR